MFIGEGDYNINVLKEIKITDSYLGLDQDVKKCQNVEQLQNCTTRHFIESLLGACKCLPFNLRISTKVMSYFINALIMFWSIGSTLLFKRYGVCQQDEGKQI